MKQTYRRHGGYQGPRAERLQEHRRQEKERRFRDTRRREETAREALSRPVYGELTDYRRPPEIYMERQADWGRSRKRSGHAKTKTVRTSPKVPSRQERFKTELRMTGRNGTEHLETAEMIQRRLEQNAQGEETARPRSFLNSRSSRYNGERARRMERSEVRKETEALYQDHVPVIAADEETEIIVHKKSHRFGKFILGVFIVVLLWEAVMLGLLMVHPEWKAELNDRLQGPVSVVTDIYETAKTAVEKRFKTEEKSETTAPSEEPASEEVNLPETETPAGESNGRNASTEAGAIGTGVQEPIHLMFAGDINLTDHVLNAYRRSRGIAGVVSPKFLNDIQQADYFVANEEFPFSDGGTPAPDKQFTFRVAPENIKLFKELDLDLVTLANNHALDYGETALMDSIDTLEKAGIRHIGAGKNLDEARKAVTVSIKGKTISFIAATRVIPEATWAAGPQSAGLFSAYDEGKLLAEDIREAKKSSDYVIVYLHWGEERKEMPNDAQKLLAHAAVDAGADLVVGAHPHVLQGIEYYKGVPVVYSLGNFIFGSSIPKTALLSVTLEQPEESDGKGKGNLVLKLLPGTSSRGYTEELTETEDRKSFYQYMTSISSGITISDDGTIERITAK